MRKIFNLGQGVVSNDFNALQKLKEKEAYESIFQRLLSEDPFDFEGLFVGDAFEPSAEAGGVDVKAGLAFQHNPGVAGSESKIRPIILEEDASLDLTGGDFTMPNDSKAILVVRSLRPVTDTEELFIKDQFGQVTPHTVDVESGLSHEFDLIVEEDTGEPFPETPSGWALIAEVERDGGGTFTLEDKRAPLKLNADLILSDDVLTATSGEHDIPQDSANKIIENSNQFASGGNPGLLNYYREETVTFEDAGSEDMNGKMHFERINDTVTATWQSISHNSNSGAGVFGAIPNWALPQTSQANVYAANLDVMRNVRFQPETGIVSFLYVDYSGSPTNLTETDGGSISYSVKSFE